MTPQTFERFTIVRKLPAGGMGRVYEAVDTSNGGRVALKLIDRATDSDSMQVLAAERLGVELHKRLCALDPRVTAVLDTGDTDDYFYIVMEYVDGQDLSELAATERIGYPFAARIAQDVLEVLAIAHNFAATIDGREYHGIVHGDIKPRNIRMTTVGQTKVLDFGIAKALSATRDFTQNVFGSVQYSSPERLSTGEVTISSDLWAVGVVLFEMVARHPYFQGESAAKLDRTIRAYSEIDPLPDGLPDTLRQILRRALAPDLADRYPSAEAFAADLRAFRSNGALAIPFDGEATRRTSRTAEVDGETRRTVATVEADTGSLDAEATRRTSRPTDPPEPTMPAKAAVAEAPKRTGPRWGRMGLIVFLVLGVIASALLAREFFTLRAVQALARDIESEREPKVEVAWQRYQTLSNRAMMGWTMWSAQDALRNRMLRETDRVIAQYRSAESPLVTEGEWIRARLSAARALELVPRDKEVRGRLRIVDGHLDRIRGTARRDAKLLEQAREEFDEAAQLEPSSPDPWLGLARLDVYSLHDVEAAERALNEAEKRHFSIGKRETALLADGYMFRGERTLKEAQNAASDPERDRYLDLARKDLEKAKQFYESITPWGGSASSLRRTYDDIQKLDAAKTPPAQEPNSDDSKHWWQKIPGLQ